MSARSNRLRSRRRFRRSLALVAAGLLAVGGTSLSGDDHPVAAAEPLAGAGASAAATDPGAERVTVIVEFGARPAIATGSSARTGMAAAKAQVRQLREAHDAFLTTASRRGVRMQRDRDYTAVFNGMAVSVPAGELQRLRALPGVVDVHPNIRFRASLAVAVRHVHAPEVWKQQDPSGLPVTGNGQTVAVLDTGIDYHHPDLGGCLGPECRVVGGFDFVNNDADPDDDAYHGTHVAGIIGASGAERGIAPDVHFLAYKVLDAAGNGTLSDILAGLEAATDPYARPRPSVINMSLGSADGDGTDVLSRAVQTAAESGYVVVAAAGNSGPGGQTIGSPASAPGAITVGADTTGVLAPELTVVGHEDYRLRAARMGFSANPPPSPLTLDVVDVGEGTAADYEGLDVTGKAVLVNSAATPQSWFTDAVVAEEHGALLALQAQRDLAGPVTQGRRPEGVSAPQNQWQTNELASGDDGRLDDMMAVGMPYSSADHLRGLLADGGVQVRVDAVDATDTIPGFSSRGPSGLLTAKPDLVAPGVEIRSTIPVGEFGAPYGRVSGTSMAAPMVAGAAVLLHQLHPRWQPDQLAAALTGSARRLEHGGGPLDQGAGLLDIAAATDVPVTASPRTLSFGLASTDGRTVSASRTVTLTNLTSVPQEFDLAVRESGEVDAAVRLSQRHLRLLPGERADVRVRVRARDPGTSTDVSGWITADVNGTGRDDLSIPYQVALRPLDVFVTPDPVIDGSEVFVRAPAELATPPTVTVHGPRGFTETVTARHDHGYWWRAPVQPTAVGGYRVSVRGMSARAFGSAQLLGSARFEKIAGPQRGGYRWTAAGPNSSGGEMAPSPSDPRDVLVASDRSTTTFRTTDGGRTWQQASTIPLAGGSGFGAQPMLAADPTTPGRYYLGIDSGQVDPTYAGALFVSDDSGRHWHRLPYPDERVLEMAVGGDGRTLAVVAEDALYLSTDAGNSWRSLWGPWQYIVDVYLEQDRVYLGTSDGLFAYSGVGGDLSGPELLFAADDWNPTVRAVAAEGDRVFLWNSATDEPIYASTDAGRTWSPTFAPPTTFMIGRDLAVIDGDVWATSDEGAWVGHDYGTTWTAAELPPTDGWPGDVEAVDGSMLVSVDTGIYSTGDEGASYRRSGIQGVDVPSLALSEDAAGRSVLVAGTTWDSYRTVLGGNGLPPSADWGHAVGEGGYENGALLMQAVGDTGTVYKVVDEGFGTFGIYRSDDAGDHWELLQEGGSEPTALLVDSADPNSVYVAYRYYTLSQGILISHDGGASWQREPGGHAFAAMVADPRNPGRVLAGDETGLYESTDAGHSFQRLSDHPVSALAVDPDDPEHVVAAGRQLLSSDDGGRTFTAAGYRGLALHIADLEFGPSGAIYAAASSFYDQGLPVGGRGVLVSRDGGRSYHSMSAGLPGLDVMTVEATASHVYAGLRGGGVYVAQRPAA